MPHDLLQPVMHWLSPGLLQKLSGFLGESPDATRAALSAGAPALLGGMIQNGSTMAGAENMVGAIRRSGVDGSYLEHSDEVLAGGAPMERATTTGADLLQGFLGGKRGAVADFLANFAHIRLDSASKLLGLIAPMFAAGLARGAPGGLNASKLMSMLSEQRDTVRRHAPPELARVVGLTERPAGAPRREGGSIWPWILGLAAVALLFLFGLNTCARREAQVGQLKAPVAPVERAAPVAPAAPAPQAEPMEKLALPGGATIDVFRGGVNDSLYRFLNSGEAAPRTFTFDHLNFDTATATLTPDSNPTVDSLAAIMKAYPAAAVRLEGHTDNEGDIEPNQTLSESRARRVADMLIARGVDVTRIETVGFGETRPIASNDAETGRAQNRRIDLVVTRK